MTSYFKIEIFAYNLFNTVWFKSGLISRKYDAIQIYKDECLADSDFEVVCDKLFYDAILCRRILFQRIYMEEITKEKDKYWDSVSDFYEYIQSICNRYDWFGCLTVFERIFATCAFVINLCFYNRENENVDIIKFGHICWATYFDAFTEEFYEQGGWNQLKRASSCYTLPLMFLQTCLQDPENVLPEVTEAIENYNTLKKTSIIQECETVSNLWVKSRIKILHRSSYNPIEFAGYETYLHAEYILNELKRLCSPCDLEVLQFDEECSERTTFDSDSFYIPLTPTESQESMQENSFSISFDGTGVIPERLGENVLLTSSSDCGEIFSYLKTDDNDLVNQSSLNELEDIINSNSFDDISCGCLHIYEQPIEFESISIISDWEQDQYLSRSMARMHLNHETLELEETKISEKDLYSYTNNSYSVGKDPDLSTKDLILVPRKVTDKQCLMLEDSSNGVALVHTDTLISVLYVTEGKPSRNKGFKEGKFVSGTMFFNTAASYDNKISISEWDERDLVKNISTPIKQKKS